MNKSFNIDIASISAPVKSTVTVNGALSATALVVGVPPQPQPLHGLQPSLLSAVAKTNSLSLNSRRAFTAALTATANNIIGKHKPPPSDDDAGEIRVTEDEDKVRAALAATLSALEDDASGSTGSACSDEDGQHRAGGLRVASSHTSSTAVSSSNCSSTHLGPPYHAVSVSAAATDLGTSPSLSSSI